MKTIFAVASVLLLSGCFYDLSPWSRQVSETVAEDVVNAEYPGQYKYPADRLTPEARRRMNETFDELRRLGEEARLRDLERGDRWGGFLIQPAAHVGSSSRSLDARIANTYGISRRAARNFITLLGQSAANDTRGLTQMGLTAEVLPHGELSPRQLAQAGAAIGVSPHKLRQLIHHFSGR